jgi:hypothetical protein
MAFIYDLTDTWNAGGTTFNAIKMNVTDTASAAASKLVSLQVGGAERFGVRKDGQGYFAGNVGIGTGSPQSKFHVFDGVATITSANNGADTFATRADSIILTRNNLSPNWQNKITSSWSGNSFDTSMNFELATGPTTNITAMTLLANGNVGIGTTSPGDRLHVDGGNIRIGSSTGANYIYSASSGLLGIQVGTGPLLFLRDNGSNESMRIDSSGNVGIGTTSPSSKLDVAGTVRFVDSSSAGPDLEFGNIGGGTSINNVANARNHYGAFEHVFTNFNNSTERMRITSAGDVGIGTSSPAQRLTVAGNILTTSAAGTDSFINVTTSGVQNSLFGFNNSGSTNAFGAANNTTYIGSGNSFNVQLITNGSPAMTITNTLNVGIGTSSPGERLTVSGGYANFAGLRIAGTDHDTSNNIYLASGDLSLSTNTGALLFKTGLTERMRIDSSGNLLVGTTSTTMGQTGIIMQPAFGGNIGNIDIGHANGTATGNSYVRFYYNAGVIGSITQDGTTAVLYNTTSDARLKENVAPADDAAALIDAIQVRKFDWKVDGSHQRYGFIAQELVEVAPEAVSQPADPDEMMGVDYSKLVPMLVKELQSVRARLAQLEGN